jgi:hypothetical protein
MYQQLFDEAIGDPPPSTVDIDRVIDRQRRGMNRRRLGAVGGSAAVALLAGALFWAVPPDEPTPTTPALAPPTASIPADNAARLSYQAFAAVFAAVPGVRFDATFEMLPDHKQDGLVYTGAALITVGGLPARVQLQIIGGSVSVACGDPADCRTSTGPNGETVTVVGGGHATVDRHAVDGTTVEVDVSGIRSGNTTPPLPVTEDQIIKIGEYPGLRIMP